MRLFLSKSNHQNCFLLLKWPLLVVDFLDFRYKKFYNIDTCMKVKDTTFCGGNHQ